MTEKTVTPGTPAASADSTPQGARWYALAPDEVAHRLAVDPATGLSAARAAELLARNGPNALPAEKAPPPWHQFFAQYTSYMQIILVGAAIASILIGQFTTGVAVLAITALNALGGMRQQGKAESAMNALQSMLKTSARVRRDGSEVTVDADQVVVGDVVLLAAGDDVCADGRLIEATSLQIDESALTGESVPASKSADPIADDNPVLGDQSNMAFMNTPVTHGGGVMIITGTGADTAVGSISGMLKSEPTVKTPLTQQLDTLTLWIAGAAGLTIAIMFALGISRGESTQVIFTTAIALALAAVPMAMPTVLQVILSSGSRELAANGAVVKSLDSVETLGSTSAINSDKTGTLTMNQVTVVEVIDPTDRYSITGRGYSLDGEVHHTAGSSHTIEPAILPFVLSNDARLVDGKVVGDPTEGALLVLGHKVKLDLEGTQAAYPRLATLPFDPTYKLMAVFCEATDDEGNAVVRVFVKGAAPAVIGRATSALSKGRSVPWGDELNTRSGQEMARLGDKGLRIMAAATKDLKPQDFTPDGDLLSMVQGLQLTAIVGMMDPPRPESLDAVRAAQDANIRVRMVTGDDVVTGAAIARQLGIPGEAILGTELAAMSEAERLERIDAIGVVGRVAPEHKVLMVQTLRQAGDVVAMTGDGVNDAPAIKAADIGIAMGTGTQVAKNAGRMILTDDNFATIVRAVSQGRKLYDNMLKYIRFMLVALVTYVVTFLLASLLNIADGQPFTARQILWINFVITAPVGIALGLDRETPGLMKRHPRPRSSSIMSAAVITTVAAAGLFMSMAIDLLIVVGESGFDQPSIARTMGLVAFSLMLVVAAFESRDERASILTTETFDNGTLNLTAVAEIVLAVLIAEGAFLPPLLETTPLTGGQWLLGAAPALVLLVGWELGKLIARRRSGRARPTTPSGVRTP
ncbi:cation-translocating P-type ATPase [Pengzhenrongella frigida]|uniref:Cation-transporting P-type ATPase n=1 Tax=Pengzhenrongella frigida TaxID=1259133 RepID=A0A4Q5N3X2_9MICO|nr:cation-transporting P-type ATPase [Cellulomonas sp. HLT2-17]RYV52855.1 cation-transporting P-type ATPase [Cellulomonas sp. HLT2-17]